MTANIEHGLTEQEAQNRRKQGLGNDVAMGTSRTLWDIARANLFTFFNNILFVIGVALISLGRVNDAVTSVGIGLVNALISTVQEIRAKRKLDEIALVARPEITIIRDGKPRVVGPEELVQGDVIRIAAGDQVVVDGRVVGDGRLEMDESLLTGEPDLIRKSADDELLSGSFCVTGSGLMVAEKVGADSFANQLTATARSFQVVYTPLQKKIDLVVRIVMLAVAVMSIVIFIAGIMEGLSNLRLVQIAAVLSGQVPYGLFLMIIVAYALGASTIAQQGALVQQVNAIESLSNIDVLCTDKTGTLTANRLKLETVIALDGQSADTIKPLIGTFVRSASSQNKTSEAIAHGTDSLAVTPIDEVSFASARKWSALAFDTGPAQGVWALGAVEMLARYLPGGSADQSLLALVQEQSDLGLRVLLFAGNPDARVLHGPDGEPTLPLLRPMGLVVLSDELRPQVRETISAFRSLGIRLKVISGDNPKTVAALAKQAGLGNDLTLYSGPQLAAMSDSEFDVAAHEGDIFGRIAPEQKERLVDALLRADKRVAMMGDGVNDVLSLKKASLGIAMQSGSSATRNVADIILLNDSFASLQPAFMEGRRIIGGMTNALYLFLARVVMSMLLILGVTMVGLNFPFDPAQVALTTFTVGIPSFFLTLWARPEPLDGRLLYNIMRFTIPVGIITMLFGLGIYVVDYNSASVRLSRANLPNRIASSYEAYTGVEVGSDASGEAFGTIAAQSSLSIFVSCTAFLLILFLEPPHRFFLGWRDEITSDRRPAYLAVGLLILFQIIYVIEPVAEYFGIIGKPERLYAQLMGLVVVWMFVVRAAWRYRVMERMLNLD